jgi:hypothetical protein
VLEKWFVLFSLVTMSTISIICSLCFIHVMSCITSGKAGADPGFQVRGGALKKIAASGGRRGKFWGISCEKSRFYAKKIIFFPILGEARAGCAPPWIRP